MQVISGP